MESAVAGLMARVRAGDETAAHELVVRFGPQIRRAIRVRLAGSRLRRVLDSEDLLQSVFRTFWQERDTVQADEPGQLVTWLRAVAVNRLNAHARAAAADKRGGAQVNTGSGALAVLAADGPSPLSEVATRDLLERLLERFGPDERRIALARADEVPWEELARREGTTAEALRKQFTRAVRPLLG